MMIFEILIISANGDIIIQKTYRHGLDKNISQIFVKNLEEKGPGLLPPVVKEGDISIFHIKRHNLYFVACSKHDVSAILVIEFLTRIYNLCRDFCGRVNEESLRTNLVLVYEVLDEVMDYGYMQIVSTEKLKPYIQSDPIQVKSTANKTPGLFGIEHREVPGDASSRPVIRNRFDQEMRKNEIFVDVIERITVLIAENGSIVRAEVQGQLNMKCFVVGLPEVKLGLNEDLSIGQKDKGYGKMVNLDQCSFHNSVKLDEFDDSKMLTIRPPEGEFSVLTYQLSGDLPHSLPLRMYTYVKDSETGKDLEVGLKLRCEIPSSCHAVNVNVHLPVPKSTTSVSQQLSGPGQTAELVPAQHQLLWQINKLHGRSEVSAHFKLISGNLASSSRMELGPIALRFEISGYVCSNLQVRFLRVFDREHSYVPRRWVRYITTSDSYICKI